MIPEFEETIVSFREFIKYQDAPDRIVWVAPEHTICCGFQEWKIFQDECINESDIKAIYQAAREKFFGMRLCVLCTDSEISYCYLYVPVDEVDAEYNLLANGCVKMRVPEDMPHTSIVRRGVRTAWLQLKESIRFRKWKNMAFRID
jgi:hypothetical protein